jgi:aspartate-semialdehyde dehydrogenase
MVALVLGATGMLGHELMQVLSPRFDVAGKIALGYRHLRAPTPGAPERPA